MKNELRLFNKQLTYKYTHVKSNKVSPIILDYSLILSCLIRINEIMLNLR